MSPQQDGSSRMVEFERRLGAIEDDLDDMKGQQIEQLKDLAELRGDMKGVRIELGTLSKSLDTLVSAVNSMKEQASQWKGSLSVILFAAPVIASILGALAMIFFRWYFFGVPPKGP